MKMHPPNMRSERVRDPDHLLRRIEIMSAQSNRSPRRPKASKKLGPAARPDGCPLWLWNGRYWANKIRGRMYYFGAADELKGALDRYERERPYLEAGRTPPEESSHEGQHVTMADLCNHFLTSKLHKLENGELAASTFDDYRQTCDKVINHFGRSRRVDELTPTDFQLFRQEMARTVRLVTLRNDINRIKILFRFGQKLAMHSARRSADARLSRRLTMPTCAS